MEPISSVHAHCQRGESCSTTLAPFDGLRRMRPLDAGYVFAN